MRVYEPGTTVFIGDGTIQGELLKVCICNENYVKYQVVWWNGGERKVKWLDYREIHTNYNSETIRIDYE